LYNWAYFNAGTANDVRYIVYKEDSNTAEPLGSSGLAGTGRIGISTAVSGKLYYIEVVSYNNNYGTYKIAYNNSASTSPVPPLLP